MLGDQLEDFHGGWGTDMEWFQSNSKLGQIGQEIYGAGGPIWYALWQDEINNSEPGKAVTPGHPPVKK